MEHVVEDGANWPSRLATAVQLAEEGESLRVGTYVQAQLARRALDRLGKNTVTVGCGPLDSPPAAPREGD